MPKVSKESATRGGDYGVVVDRADEVEGYSINFTTFREDIDATPLLKGLPDDRCQCPHWGYVIAGRMRFVFGDQEEVYEAGDAFYQPPGHRPYVDAGTELLQFSPSDKLVETERAVEEWMSRQQPDTP